MNPIAFSDAGGGGVHLLGRRHRRRLHGTPISATAARCMGTLRGGSRSRKVAGSLRRPPLKGKPLQRQPDDRRGVEQHARRQHGAEPSPTMIGERVSTRAAARSRQLLLNDDYDSVIPIAVQQVSGAHMLDVQVALTERADEAEQMKTWSRSWRWPVETPLIIDVTEPAVAEAALSVYPGRRDRSTATISKTGASASAR
ncbi:MAG: hypothetical protein U0521_10365 [Anaerolineae bacterium]